MTVLTHKSLESQLGALGLLNIVLNPAAHGSDFFAIVRAYSTFATPPPCAEDLLAVPGIGDLWYV